MEWPLESEEWVFLARLDHIVDGDTFDFVLDLGFRTYKKARVRLYGVDTAEIHGVKHGSEEYQLGMRHKAWVADWFKSFGGAWPYLVSTAEDTGKYGRWPGLVRPNGDGIPLRQVLIRRYPDVNTLGS